MSGTRAADRRYDMFRRVPTCELVGEFGASVALPRVGLAGGRSQGNSGFSLDNLPVRAEEQSGQFPSNSEKSGSFGEDLIQW